jgi:hypothetical protein
MGVVERLPPRIQERVKAELVKYYFGNSIDYDANVEGVRRIKLARRQSNGEAFDPKLRTDYERNQCSRLEGQSFEPKLFESIRSRAVAALSDPERSPCVYNRGEQARAQGIPQDLIKHDYLRQTKDVRSVIPDAPALLNRNLVQAIRSCIGSNFYFEWVYLKRLFHSELELQSRYEVLSERWHFDHQYPDGFSLFVNLTDCTVAEGPTHWINRPDSLRMLRKGFNASRRIESPSGGLPAGMIEQCPSFERLLGPAGSMALIHTSYCLHRAGIPEPGLIRDTICFTFRPSAEMNLDWPAKSN